jgi:hypothetical protein
MAFQFDSCLEKGRELQTQGAGDEDLLRLFRNEGAGMFDSVKLIKALKQGSLKDAQELVHFSATWADCRGQHEQLQDDLFEAARQMGATIIDGDEE